MGQTRILHIKADIPVQGALEGKNAMAVPSDNGSGGAAPGMQRINGCGPAVDVRKGRQGRGPA